MVLTVSLPSLMLNLINTAYFGFGQILPGILAILFSKRATATGVGSGILTGIAVALFLHFSEISIFSINNGLIALFFNFTVTIIVSLATSKNVQLLTPMATIRTQK